MGSDSRAALDQRAGGLSNGRYARPAKAPPLTANMLGWVRNLIGFYGAHPRIS
jgi:hypothetical protein